MLRSGGLSARVWLVEEDGEQLQQVCTNSDPGASVRKKWTENLLMCRPSCYLTCSFFILSSFIQLTIVFALRLSQGCSSLLLRSPLKCLTCFLEYSCYFLTLTVTWIPWWRPANGSHSLSYTPHILGPLSLSLSHQIPEIHNKASTPYQEDNPCC